MLRGRFRWRGGAVIAAAIAALLTVIVVGLLVAQPTTADRAYTLEQRLRCPTCKSVAISESPSQTAASMRQIVADQVAAGRSDEQIIAYFTERYGQWVLLDPPPAGAGLLLWLLPLVAAAVGVVVLLTRRRRPPDEAADLPEPERRVLEAALREYRSRAEDDEP
ncbi:hypothetical protein BKD30_10650 [Tersicoccus phoenicis]|uniref:Cytochrome c-type biogenesis protein n=1 Tax=Tersicoccus phoenicis TaxID=554083 RepID=A0A1R1L8I6_9MICC|nr:cytochrome c-type biogenesis protein CcmH [Tersicoccus phoenicis]OMH23827.1 hypothetical protein BKD30_10650 [Tersicoccus phoenicis]